MKTQGETVLIYGLSVENVGILSLYTTRKITKGTLHTSRVISVRESTENFYVRIAAKIHFSLKE